MRILLDTHTFIWWFDSPQRLSARVLAMCQDSNNSLVVSVVSLWEILIKQQIGKLELSRPLVDIVREQQQVNTLAILPVELDHVLEVEKLPLHHRDPFDRLLISQALSEEMPIVSVDPLLRPYPVTILW